MTVEEHEQPDAQDESRLADLEVDDEASADVRGGMTKQEHVEQLSSPADDTKRP